MHYIGGNSLSAVILTCIYDGSRHNKICSIKKADLDIWRACWYMKPVFAFSCIRWLGMFYGRKCKCKGVSFRICILLKFAKILTLI